MCSKEVVEVKLEPFILPSKDSVDIADRGQSETSIQAVYDYVDYVARSRNRSNSHASGDESKPASSFLIAFLVLPHTTT